MTRDKKASLTRRRFGNWLTRAEAKGGFKRGERRRIRMRLRDLETHDPRG